MCLCVGGNSAGITIRRSHLAAKVGSNEDHALAVAGVQHRLFQLFRTHEFANPGAGAAAAAAAKAVKLLLMDVDDLAPVQARDIGGVFQRLPGNVAAGIV